MADQDLRISFRERIEQRLATERRVGRAVALSFVLLWLAGVGFRLGMVAADVRLDPWVEAGMDLGILTAVLSVGAFSARTVRVRRQRWLRDIATGAQHLERAQPVALSLRSAVDELATALYAAASAAAIIQAGADRAHTKTRQAAATLSQSLQAGIATLRRAREATTTELHLVDDALTSFSRFDALLDSSDATPSAASLPTPGHLFGAALIVAADPLAAAASEMALLHMFERVDVESSLQNAAQRLEWQIYDLAVVDIELPDGAGTTLVTQLRDAGAGTAIVAISDRDDDASVVAAAFKGADTVLGYPFGVTELQATVWELYREAALSQRAAAAPDPRPADRSPVEAPTPEVA